MLKIRGRLKKFTLIAAFLLIIILSLQAPWQYFLEGKPLNLEIALKIPQNDIIQLFYTTDKNADFSEEGSIKANVNGLSEFQTVKFTLPERNVRSFRIDTGSNPGEVAIKNIKLKSYKTQYIWGAENIRDKFQFSGSEISGTNNDNYLYINITSNDPSMISSDVTEIFKEAASDGNIYLNLLINLLLIFLSAIYILISLYKRVSIFIRDILNARRLIFELAKKDLKNRYLGSYLGIIWAFIQPLITILIFWFVFQIGFKSIPVDNFPFVLWLICGMVPWFFFSEAVQSATNSILDNSYLVKKVVFRVSSLPIIRILSSLFIHLFFILVIFVMFIIYGYMPSIYNLQVIYYLIATIFLVLGISWITSSLVVFLRDLGQIVSIFIQFGFWLTPIFWSFKIMPEKYQFLFKLNPVYYIVEGYRDTFINHIWFWQHYNLTICFWVITLGLFFIGALLFKRLRPHFADVL